MNQILKFRTTNNKTEISKTECDEIRAADVMYSSLRMLIADILESHVMDAHDIITESAMFTSLLSDAADALRDFDTCKSSMIDRISIGTDSVITDWSLDYETGILSYDVSPANRCEKAEYGVAKNICDKVQSKQLLHTVATDVISYLVSSHAMDASDRITASVVFRRFSELKARFLREFEVAKEEMFRDTVPIKNRDRYASWNLNYLNMVLTCYCE